MKMKSPSSSTSKKILVVYGSIGLGHKVVAENIAAALAQHPGVEIVKLDTVEMYRGRFLQFWGGFYEWMIKSFPALWRFFYTNRLFQKLTLPLRRPFAGANVKKFANFVREVQPDLILTTHPFATALTTALKKKKIYHGPIVTSFSDFHFQPYWVYPLVDHYFVMTAEQKAEVAGRGFSPKRITITGLPVDKVFLENFQSGETLRELGLSHSKPVVAVMGGSRGWGIRLSDIKALLASSFDVQIAVIVGKNPELARRLQALARSHPKNLKIFSLWSNLDVAKIFSVAKLLITKPGGLTIAQALVKNLPMVLVNPLPTMEEMNQDYLVRAGAAVAAKTSAQARQWVERLLADKKFYQEIQDGQKKLARLNAGEAAAQVVIDMLEMRY